MVVKLSDFLSTNFVPSALDSGDVLTIVRANTIAIDSNTTGNYVDTIIGGAGITVTDAGAHAATPTITFDSSMIVGVNATQTLTNKTINLTNNTLSATLGQLNAAVSGATLVSTDGAETLTNKTLTSPTINTPNITAGSITDITTFGLRDITTTAYETRIVSNNVTPALSADRTLTLDVNNANRTVSLTGNLTLGGNFTTSGAHATTLTTSGTTALTLPTSGTLVSKDGSGNVTIAGTLTGELDRSANTTVEAGVYGSASLVPVLTIDSNGFVDSAGSVSVAGVASLGFDSATHTFTINTADGGSFSEIVQTKMPGTSGSFGSASQVPIITVNQYGLVDSISEVSVAGVSSLAFDSATHTFTINTADGGSFNEIVQTKMPGASGSFGSASLVPIITVNQFGLVDSISTVSVAGVSTFDFDSATGKLTIGTADGGSFQQVLTLDPYTTTNLTEGTNQYYTDARARGALSGGTGITYNSGTGEITTTDADIVHDNLSGFVADEHVAHTGVSITAGAGLTGGGNISASRTLNVIGSAGITVNADNVVIDSAHVRGLFSASGDLSYNSGTGAFSFSETYSTPSELLTAIKTVDGATSGLDADTLDGQEGSYYRIDVYDASGTLLN